MFFNLTIIRVEQKNLFFNTYGPAVIYSFPKPSKTVIPIESAASKSTKERVLKILDTNRTVEEQQSIFMYNLLFKNLGT